MVLGGYLSTVHQPNYGGRRILSSASMYRDSIIDQMILMHLSQVWVSQCLLDKLLITDLLFPYDREKQI